MTKKNVLGRGLGALIDDAPSSTIVKEQSRVTIDNISDIDIDRIETNPFQPRQTFNEEALDDLCNSIRQLGVIQPITVRKNGDKFQLITGERRYRASKLAGLTTIPAYVRVADDQAMLEMAIVENVQREDLDAIEIAIGYQRLIDECSITQEHLSERVGKKRTTITNYLRLLKLPPEIQLGIREKKLTMGHARAIVNVETIDAQLKLFGKIVKEDLSVRQIEDLVRKLAEPKHEKTNHEDDEKFLKEYEELKEKLTSYFGAKIGFHREIGGAGKIVIPFNTDEELEKILTVLDVKKE